MSLTAAEKAARRRLIEQEARERRAQERAEVLAGVDETVALGEARGEAFARPPAGRGERDKPLRRKTGLDFLLKAERINVRQHAAGLMYGNAWRAAKAEAHLKSCLAEPAGVGGDGPSPAAVLDRAVSRAHAQGRLNAYRADLGHQADLVRALDLVCGEERTPREASRDGHEAAVMSALVVVGLHLLAGRA